MAEWLFENFTWMLLVIALVAIVWAFSYGKRERAKQREASNH